MDRMVHRLLLTPAAQFRHGLLYNAAHWSSPASPRQSLNVFLFGATPSLSQNCHPERSEGSSRAKPEMLRVAQHDGLLELGTFVKTVGKMSVPFHPLLRHNIPRIHPHLCLVAIGYRHMPIQI